MVVTTCSELINSHHVTAELTTAAAVDC